MKEEKEVSFSLKEEAKISFSLRKETNQCLRKLQHLSNARHHPREVADPCRTRRASPPSARGRSTPRHLAIICAGLQSHATVRARPQHLVAVRVRPLHLTTIHAKT